MVAVVSEWLGAPCAVRRRTPSLVRRLPAIEQGAGGSICSVRSADQCKDDPTVIDVKFDIYAYFECNNILCDVLVVPYESIMVQQFLLI